MTRLKIKRVKKKVSAIAVFLLLLYSPFVNVVMKCIMLYNEIFFVSQFTDYQHYYYEFYGFFL